MRTSEQKLFSQFCFCKMKRTHKFSKTNARNLYLVKIVFISESLHLFLNCCLSFSVSYSEFGEIIENYKKYKCTLLQHLRLCVL